MLHLSPKKVWKDDLGNHRPLSLSSFPRENRGTSPLGTNLWHTLVEKAGNSQHVFLEASTNKDLCCDLSYFMCLSGTWRRWCSALSERWQMILNWRDQQISWKAGLPSRATQSGWKKKKWTDRSLIKLIKNKCKMLPLGRKTLWSWYRLGTNSLGTNSLGSGRCGKKSLGDSKLNMIQQCTLAPKTASSIQDNINRSLVG